MILPVNAAYMSGIGQIIDLQKIEADMGTRDPPPPKFMEDPDDGLQFLDSFFHS